MSFPRAPLRTVIASSSRLLLPLPTPAAFSTSVPSFGSRERRARIRQKRDANIALQSARSAAAESARPSPIYGSAPTADGRPSTALWESCRLRRVLLSPEDVYNVPPTNYAAQERPAHFLPGLTDADADLLLGALPGVSVELKMKGEGLMGRDVLDQSRSALSVEGQKNEQMLRLLDLRNANKAGIEAVNRQRVIEEFGRKREGKGVDTGSSEVQAALLTQKIRSLAEHLNANSKDVHNKRALRMLVHQRAKVLKYFARTKPALYEPLLADLGLERRAVEGEITL